MLELRYSPALEHGCSPALELGRKRTLPPGNNFKPEVWHKNNKALIKAGNLKGLLGYPTYLGLRTPWRFTIGPVRTAHAAYKEDSTRLGAQDKDSSKP